MSYRCGSCNTIVDRGISKSKNSRVTETRPRVYHTEKTRVVVEGDKQYKVTEMVPSYGTEIVKVTAFCPTEAKFFDETNFLSRAYTDKNWK